MKKFAVIMAAAFVALIGVTPIQAENLVLNGNFEDGEYNPTYPSYGNNNDFPVYNWYFTGGFGLNDEVGPFWDVAKKPEVSGKYILFMQNAGIAAQDVDGFVKGKVYTLRFLERRRNCCGSPLAVANLVVRIGGEEVVAEHALPVSPFTEVSKDFTASADGLLTLEFEMTTPDAGDNTMLLDAVSIVPKGEANPYTLNPAPETVKNPGWPVNAVQLSSGQKITIDGKVTAGEYKGAQAMVINKNTVTAVPDPYFPLLNHNGKTETAAQLENTSLEDYSGTYYFMWDDQYFYAGLSAVDNSNAWNGPDPNGADALQFVFAKTPDEKATSNMYIPTISPKDADGVVHAKNDFGGWITEDIMTASTFAGYVNDNGSWSVEIKIPWNSMTQFKSIFPPKSGSVVGFAVLAIDYDIDPATEVSGTSSHFFACNNPTFPWESAGVEKLYFIATTTAVSEWSLF